METGKRNIRSRVLRQDTSKLFAAGSHRYFCRGRCWFFLVGVFYRDDGLRFAPFRVVPADHNVEAPVAAFFFRLHEPHRLHVEEVMLHPANLLFAQPTAL